MEHRSAQSTQHYAKISATKMAQSYARSGYFERNLRAIDVLIDQETIRSGAAAMFPGSTTTSATVTVHTISSISAHIAWHVRSAPSIARNPP